MVHVLKIFWNSTEKSKGQVKGTQFYGLYTTKDKQKWAVVKLIMLNGTKLQP